MIWDTFMFAGEADMLYFRLEHLAGKVDRHIIAEADETHRGVPRELWVPRHLGCCLAPYRDRIFYIPVQLSELTQSSPWAREHYQRDQLAWRCLFSDLIGELDPDDLVIIADVDEIPSDKALHADLQNIRPRAVALSMRTFHSAVDWEYTEPQLATVLTLAGNISWPYGSLSAIRDSRMSLPVLQDGGWHFSWLGTSADRVRKLDERTCHNTDMGEWEAHAIRTGATYDTGEHAGISVKPVDVDETMPEYLQKHRCPDSWFRPRLWRASRSRSAPRPAISSPRTRRYWRGSAGTPYPSARSSSGSSRSRKAIMVSFTDAALLISAYKRPSYFVQTLGSWSAARRLEEFRRVTIALGRSPREDEQEHLIREWDHAIVPPVWTRYDSAAAVVSPGMHRALGEAMQAEFENDSSLRFLVCSEEDILVSDDVLDYMAWAREQFEDDETVLTVSAHNPLGQGWHQPYDDSDADQETVRLHPQFHPWCWGTWRDRWEKHLLPGWDWDASSGLSWNDNGYDWQVCRIMEREHLYAVTPDASRSQNIGQYEGCYALPENYALTQAASYRQHREDPHYRLGTEFSPGH